MTSEHNGSNGSLDDLLNRHFAGKVVRKDLTKLVKEGANVPVYVLEYLLGNYCASNDEAVIEDGLRTVKKVLAENYVRPDEAEKVKSTIREKGSLKIIDKATVTLNEKRDVYEALLGNLGVKGIEVNSSYVKKFEKLLVGGIWCIVTLEYFYEEDQKGSPFVLRDLKPIQMPNLDLDELFQGRRAFTEEQWIDVLLRSTGMEPTNFQERVKWHLLARMVPLVENNFNLAELGPRGTGKSHIYKEISPNSILVSGGQTTVANLFYNMARRQVGLVGLWDVVAFDEVAGISFKDKDGVQIMKDYMASGSFARGRDAINANASMVFVGNLNQPVDTLVKTSHLFAPFPDTMIDSAFFDRIHVYLPGWEIPKMRVEFFTDHYGFVVDYLAEALRELRKHNFTEVIDRHFSLGSHLNARDVKAVRKTFSGLLKLVFPHGEFSKDELAEVLAIALEGRRRVKEQLKKMGAFEYHQTSFSYIDNESREERFVGVPEQGGRDMISTDPLAPGSVYTASVDDQAKVGLYRVEVGCSPGTGKLKIAGGIEGPMKESIQRAFAYLMGQKVKMGVGQQVDTTDFHVEAIDLLNSRVPCEAGIALVVAVYSAIKKHSVLPGLLILGDLSIQGNIKSVRSLVEPLQVGMDNGARRALIPLENKRNFLDVSGDIVERVDPVFFSDPMTAAMKALGMT